MSCSSAVPYYAGSILSVESNQNVESRTKNVESRIASGQLILGNGKPLKLLPPDVRF